MQYQEILNGPYMDMLVRETLAMCRIPGPIGYTGEIRTYVEDKLHAMGYETSRIHRGGFLCDLGGEGDPLVVSAHLDSIGAMVSHILPNGHLHVAPLGGVVLANLDSENCEVLTRSGERISGTLQLDEPSDHASDAARTRERSPYTMEVMLDAITASVEETRALGVENGCYVFFDPKVRESNGFIKSRYLDDRAQAAILLTCAAILKDTGKTPGRHTILQFTDYEETGLGGATGMPEGVGEYLAVDVCIIGKEREGNEYSVTIVAKDARMPYDYAVTCSMIEAAKRAGAPYVVDVFPERYTSDADAAVCAGHDVRIGLFGPGVCATHGYERTHRRALAATLAMLTEYIA